MKNCIYLNVLGGCRVSDSETIRIYIYIIIIALPEVHHIEKSTLSKSSITTFL